MPTLAKFAKFFIYLCRLTNQQFDTAFRSPLESNMSIRLPANDHHLLPKMVIKWQYNGDCKCSTTAAGLAGFVAYADWFGPKENDGKGSCYIHKIHGVNSRCHNDTVTAS